MKLRWKKQAFSPYARFVVFAIPVLTVFMVGIEYNAFPHIFTKVDWYGTTENYLVTIRSMCSVVEAIEWDSSVICAFLLPMLSGLMVIPYIQMKDGLLQMGKTRMRHARREECSMILQSIFTAGFVTYLGFFLALLVCRILFLYPVHENGSFDIFFEIWGAAQLSAYEHPYLYIILLGAIRYFCAPVLYAFMTLGISYVTDKIYVYLLLPTIYAIAGMIVCSNGIVVGEWLGKRISPSNFITVWAPLDSGASATWFLVLPSLVMIGISVVCIVVGSRKQMA